MCLHFVKFNVVAVYLHSYGSYYFPIWRQHGGICFVNSMYGTFCLEKIMSYLLFSNES